jgi:hypothetical protein
MAAAEGYVWVPGGAQGTPTIQSFTADRAQRVADAHARYHNAVLNGNVYWGANLGGTSVTTQAGLSATTPALTLFNPFASTVNLVLWTFGYCFTAAPAAACGVMLAYNNPNLSGVPTAPTSTTLANVTSALVAGTKLPIGQCYRVATLSAAPLALAYFGGTTGASAIGGQPSIFDLAGQIIIPPGTAVSVQTTSASAIICSFAWEEAAINPPT